MASDRTKARLERQAKARAEHIRRLVADCPPLRPDQIRDIKTLLKVSAKAS